METTASIEVGQQWSRPGHDDRVRLVGVSGTRWVAERSDGQRCELAAGALRSEYRLISPG